MNTIRKKATHKAAAFFVLRTPALPLTSVLGYSFGLESFRALESGSDDAVDPAALRRLVASDVSRVRAHLQELIRTPGVSEALLVSSPDLFARLDVYFNNPESDEGVRLEQSLLKYVIRMSTRATPFGLCAGVATGQIGRTTNLTLAPREAWYKHIRLDMGYIAGLCQRAAKIGVVREHLRFFSNNTRYEFAGRVHYAETETMEDGYRSYKLSAAEPTEYLRRVLARANAGRTLAELAEDLVDEEITNEDAIEYLNELIDAGLLISALEPRVTGQDPSSALRSELSAIANPPAEVVQILDVLNDVAQVSMQGRIEPASQTIIESKLHAIVSARSRHVLHVDLHQPGEGLTLGGVAAAELLQGARLLNRLRMRAESETADLNRFKQLFVERYGDATVALCNVLDEEHGLRWRDANIAAADGNEDQAGGAHADGEADATIEAVLSQIVWDATRAGQIEVALSPQTVEALSYPVDLLPEMSPSFSVHAHLIAASAGDIDAGKFRAVVRSVSQHSACHWFGRFSDGDVALCKHVTQFLKDADQAEGDAIVAEIVHLPQGRLGNVIVRPQLRSYEIGIFTRTSADSVHAIAIDDLLITVRTGRIVLTSASLGKEVIPRMSSAHYPLYARNVGAYTFLWLLQFERAPTLAWRWGKLSTFPFLPRIVVGRLVLSRARWTLPHEDAVALDKGDQTHRFVEAQRLRAKYCLPRFVSHQSGDNELACDLDNPISVDVLSRLLKKGPRTLLEMYPDQENGAVSASDGAYANECIVAYVDSTLPSQRPSPAITEQRINLARVRHVHGPGSEWLYLKIYTGTATADRLLKDFIPGIIREFREKAGADRWFFIRYADPGHHLRVRVHGDPQEINRIAGSVLEQVLNPLVRESSIERVCIDAYEPETERYGGIRGLAIAEHVFCADSDACLALLDSVYGDSTDARWVLTLCGVDALVRSFADSITTAASWMHEIRNAYGAQLENNKDLRRRYATRYRDLRGRIAPLLSGDSEGNAVVVKGLEELHARSRRLATLAIDLRDLSRSNDLTREIGEIVGSLVHMHVNRMHREISRPAEVEFYELLSRHYDSITMRGPGVAKER